MRCRLPTVREGSLHEQAVEGTPHNVILVGSAQWFLWVEQHRSFRCETSSGAFTVRKEQRSGGWYWYAYRRRQGKMQTAYLGKSAELTLQRLNAVTTHLARGESAPAQPVSEDDPSQDHPASLIPQLAGLEQGAHELTLSQQTEGQHEETVPGPGPPTSSSDGGTPRTGAVERASPTTAHSPPVPLVLTKVRPPRLRSALVHRSRLMEHLEQGMEAPLTLISAPAGFGKTTLLTSWLASRGTPAAWFSVEPEDNDPVRFFTYLLTALQRLDRHLGSSLLPLLQSPRPVPLESMLALLINELSARQEPGLVLVLDDYHVVTSEPIHRAITYLVEHLPPQLHLVIASRAGPPLPLARLRARGQLSELRAADLRFGQQEAGQFLHTIMGLDLSMQESALLQSRTEGWIAGLQFAALALQGRTDSAAFLSAFSGSHCFVLDYLSEEVLAWQPPAIQAFLTATSILERLSGPLCEAVTGQEGSQSILEALERANLFVIALDEERQWYRYHHLFAEVLRNHLKQRQPDLLPALHRRASLWYEQHGLPAQAVQHALAAHDLEHAASLIEQCAMGMIGQGQIYTLLGWLSALPDALMRERPLLCIRHAAVLQITSHLQEVEARLQEAERALQAHTPAEQTRIVLGTAALIRANLAFYSGDFGRCLALARQALDLLPETEVIPRAAAAVTASRAYLMNGDVTPTSEQQVKAAVASAQILDSPFLSLRSLILLARLRMLQGHLHQAAATYRQASQSVPTETELFYVAGGLLYGIGLGDLLREWNDLKEASQHLTRGPKLKRETQAVEADVVTEGYISLAHLQQASGEYSQAEATLDAFVVLAKARSFAPHLLTKVAAVRAHLELAQGHLPAARHWAETSGLSPSDVELSYPYEREYLTLARLRLAQGRANPSAPFLEEALALLERLLAEAQAKARRHSVLEILALKALTLQGRGDLPAALDTLAQALNLAAPEGYVRLFLDEGAPMLSLLSQVGKTHPMLQDYVQRLLAHAHLTPAPLPPASSHNHEPSQPPLLLEPLSEREREVLHLMAQGASNEEIAQRLVIAVGTAKRHVSNILAKLTVSNRTQAVARAREASLL